MNIYRTNQDCNIPPTPRHDISGYKRMQALGRNPDGTVSNFYVFPKREPSNSSINAYQGNLLNSRSGRPTPDYDRSSRLRAGAPPQCQDQGYAEFLRLMGEMGNADISDYQPPADELSDWEAACIPPPIATNNVDIPKYQSSNAYNSESMWSPRSSNSYNIKSESLPKYDDFEPMVTSSFREEYSSNDSSGGLRRSLIPQDIFDYLMQDATAHDEDFRTIPCIENSSYESSNIGVHAPVASLSSSYGEQSSLHESRIPLECNHTECREASSSLHESQIPSELLDYFADQSTPVFHDTSYGENSSQPSNARNYESTGPRGLHMKYNAKSSNQSSYNTNYDMTSPQKYSSTCAEEEYYNSDTVNTLSPASINQRSSSEYFDYTNTSAYSPESPSKCPLSNTHAELSIKQYSPQTPTRRTLPPSVCPGPLHNYKQHKAGQMYSRVADEPHRITRPQRNLTFNPRDRDLDSWVVPKRTASLRLPSANYTREKPTRVESFKNTLSNMFKRGQACDKP